MPSPRDRGWYLSSQIPANCWFCQRCKFQLRLCWLFRFELGYFYPFSTMLDGRPRAPVANEGGVKNNGSKPLIFLYDIFPIVPLGLQWSRIVQCSVHVTLMLRICIWLKTRVIIKDCSCTL